MQTYIGTKMVSAAPMTRQAYNDYRNWTLPADEDGSDEGYLVEYLDGGTPNDPRHKGYISWSPKAQFDAAYQPMSGMNFGHAIALLKQGKRVAREGWNGKGMFLAHVPGGTSTTPWGDQYPALPFIVMKTATDEIVPWLASQTDILAEDWVEVI